MQPLPADPGLAFFDKHAISVRLDFEGGWGVDSIAKHRDLTVEQVHDILARLGLKVPSQVRGRR